MTTLSLRPRLSMKGPGGQRSLRDACGEGPLSLRAVLSSFSMPIYEKWQALGGGQGRLGWALENQRQVSIGDRHFTGQRFEHGTAIDFGQGTVSAALTGGGTGGGASLPEVPYMLTLESVQCHNQSQGEAGADELWIRFILSTSATLNEGGEVSSVVNYRNDNVHAGQSYPADVLLYAGSLPEVCKLSYMAIEVDADFDADQVMGTFTSKVKEHEKLWFTAGNDVFEGAMWANIVLNSLGTSLCVADPNPWVHWIGGIAGTGMEIALISILRWYKSELIGANELTLLGENLRQESQGALPEGTGEDPIEMKVLGSSATDKISFFMHCAFSRFDNGDIREERRFFGADPQVDYTLTFRHFVGTGTGPLPPHPCALSVEPDYHYAWNEQHGTSSFLYAQNKLSWQAGGSGAVAFEIERSLNGQPFVKAATVRVRDAVAPGGSFLDTFVQGSGQVIQYRIRAFNRNGFSDYSEVLTVRLPAPDVPYGLSASVSRPSPQQAQVHVYWMVSSVGDTGYVLERSRGGAGFQFVADVGANKPSTRGANHVDGVAAPSAGEVIEYRVKARNEYGEESAYSEVLRVQVGP